MWRTVWDEFSAQARIAPRSVAIPDVAEAGHVRDITYAELAAGCGKLSEQVTARTASGTCLYGAGLAKGYLDQEGLTRERFKPGETPEGARWRRWQGRPAPARR